MENLLQQIESIREIVINMIIQRDYWDRIDWIFKIFDKGLSFTIMVIYVICLKIEELYPHPYK